MNRPKILKEGDPHCIHKEDISNYTGVCRKCGQVKDYNVEDNWRAENDAKREIRRVSE